MKKILGIILLVSSGLLRLPAQGYIVPNGVRYVGLNLSGAYEIDVLQNPTNGNFTGFSFTPQSRIPPTDPYTNNFSFSGLADESVRVFLVSANQPISEQAVQSGSYTELMYPNSYGFNSGSPFYLGLYTGEAFPQNGIYSNPLFGWARLVNNQGVIQMLDSALAYGSGGIYAGTTTLIPEPGSCAITLAGLLIIGAQRFRANS